MKRPKIPTYGHHKSTGQARVYIGGRSVYLGPFGSEASRILYGQVVAKVLSGQPIDPFVTKSSSPDTRLTINELVLAFMRHATAYYSKNGKPSDGRSVPGRCRAKPLSFHQSIERFLERLSIAQTR